MKNDFPQEATRGKERLDDGHRHVLPINSAVAPRSTLLLLQSLFSASPFHRKILIR